jgi:nucleoid-associated protein YgaU
LSSRSQAICLLSLSPLLAALTPTPSVATGALTAPSADPTAPLLAVVALAAWACTAWLGVVVAVTWADRLPGVAGRAARRAGSHLAPHAVRALARVAIGGAVAASVFAGSAALADGRSASPSPLASASSTADPLDWPMSTPHAARPSTAGTRSATPTPTATPSPPPARTPVAQRQGPVAPADVAVVPVDVPGGVVGGVVVQPGDSLWSIAARALSPSASDRQVAQAWPRWWSANRAVLGADPDLIYPGTQLSAPPS